MLRSIFPDLSFRSYGCGYAMEDYRAGDTILFNFRDL